MQLTIECPNVLTRSVTTPYRYLKAEKDGVTILSGMDGKRSYIQGYDPCRFVIPLFGDLSDCLAVIRAIQKKEINITELQSPELRDVLEWFKTGRVSELSVYTTKRWGMHCRLLNLTLSSHCQIVNADGESDFKTHTDTVKKLVEDWMNSYVQYDPFIKEAFLIQDTPNKFKVLVPEKLGTLELVYDKEYRISDIFRFCIIRNKAGKPCHDARIKVCVDMLAAGPRVNKEMQLSFTCYSAKLSEAAMEHCTHYVGRDGIITDSRCYMDSNIPQSGLPKKCLASALLWLYTH